MAFFSPAMPHSSLDLSQSDPRPMQPERAMRLRALVVGTIGFLTLVDLFATQAFLPTLARTYDVAPPAIGLAVNACTIGMAISCPGVVLISGRLNRRQGIWISLALLAIPTALLALAPGLTSFAALRIAQGIFMAAAFALTMACLAEHCSAEEIAGALAAYVTGVVASNLVGRLVSASVSDLLGVGTNFRLFAALNLAGAALAFSISTACRRWPRRAVRGRRSQAGPGTCAIPRCGRASASAFSRSSPFSAFSPM